MPPVTQGRETIPGLVTVSSEPNPANPSLPLPPTYLILSTTKRQLKMKHILHTLYRYKGWMVTVPRFNPKSPPQSTIFQTGSFFISDRNTRQGKVTAQGRRERKCLPEGGSWWRLLSVRLPAAAGVLWSSQGCTRAHHHTWLLNQSQSMEHNTGQTVPRTGKAQLRGKRCV